MANPLYGSNKFDDALSSQKYIDNKMAYYSFVWDNLSLRPATESTDAKTDTGFTLVDGELAESLWDGDGAAASMVLPSAKKGVLSVFRFAAQADGGTSITFTTASDEYFEKGTLTPGVTDLGNKYQVLAPAYSQRWVQSVATGGGAIITIGAAANELVIASTATNNQTNIGAELAFFCEDKGLWKVAFLGSELGNGAINATFTIS
jgi:hypothetical protein